jgi:glutamine cyclotransferase
MKMKKTFNYQGEGWGLTNDGTSLIMSDGTNILRYINPSDFSIQKTVIVHDEGMNPVNNLNELEFINGEIWANIWMTDNIVRIDPKSGTITGWVDLTPLHQAITPNSNIDVLNGIAFEKSSGQIFLSGKNWPKIFEVKVVEKN